MWCTYVLCVVVYVSRYVCCGAMCGIVLNVVWCGVVGVVSMGVMWVWCMGGVTVSGGMRCCVHCSVVCGCVVMLCGCGRCVCSALVVMCCDSSVWCM